MNTTKNKLPNRRDFMKFSAASIAVSGLLASAEPLLAMGKPAGVESRKRPNILLIMTDQLQARVISCYGGPVDTPNIDRIAREGVKFNQAVCPTPFCSPTRASMIMGVYPHTHGVVLNVDESRQKGLFMDDVTTEKILWKNGYKTRHYGKWHLHGSDMEYYPDQYRMHPQWGMEYDQLWKQCREQYGKENCMNWINWSMPVKQSPAMERIAEKAKPNWEKHTWGDFILKMGRWKLPAETYFDVRVADQAVERLKQFQGMDDPFMLTVSLQAPHNPNLVPSPYYEMFDPETIELPENIDHCEEQFKSDVSRKMFDDFGKEGTREYMRIYYGMVKLMDDQVGRVLLALDQIGETDNTVIIFTADHGDMNGGHGLLWKSTKAFYEEVVHIPFMIRYPRMFKPHENDMAVDLTDLMPTLLDLAGQPVPGNAQGQNLVPFLTGQKDSSQGRQYAFCERIDGNPNGGEREILPSAKGSFMVRGKGWKYMRYREGQEYMYNLQEDPGEINNVVEEKRYAAVRNKMVQALHDWLERTGWQGYQI